MSPAARTGASRASGAGAATGPARRLAACALLVCVLTTAAAVLSFVHGNWLGVVWVLMAGLSSNMAWYYLRKARSRQAAPAPPPPGDE